MLLRTRLLLRLYTLWLRIEYKIGWNSEQSWRQSVKSILVMRYQFHYFWLWQQISVRQSRWGFHPTLSRLLSASICHMLNESRIRPGLAIALCQLQKLMFQISMEIAWLTKISLIAKHQCRVRIAKRLCDLSEEYSCRERVMLTSNPCHPSSHRTCSVSRKATGKMSSSQSELPRRVRASWGPTLCCCSSGNNLQTAMLIPRKSECSVEQSVLGFKSPSVGAKVGG